MPPLVGRERELDLLRQAWGEIEAGARGAALWLVGSEGSGKSRLVSDFADRVRTTADPPVYLQGRCRTLVAERPCAAVLELLQRWLGLPPGVAPGPGERTVLEHSVPPSAARALLQALDPEHSAGTAEAVPSALADWLLALARATPVLAFLDDLNFADEGTLLVLAMVAERLAGTRLLLVLGEREREPIARPQAFGHLRERLAALGTQHIELLPLERRAVLELVNRLFDHTVPRRRVAEALWARSRGNPGLLVEILRELIDTGKLAPLGDTAEAGARAQSRLSLSIAPEEIPLPRSLGTLINERFRRLSTLERAWLRRLSVVGGRLEPEFLERAFPQTSAEEMQRLLARLVEAGWLEATGTRFRFARPALRESVYRSTPKSLRDATHLAAAEALAPGPDGRIQLQPALQRAYHLHAAGEHAALLRALPPLIETMLRRGQPQRVVTLAGWGLEALAAAGPAEAARIGQAELRLSLLEAAADAADRLGRREEQRAWLDQLSDIDLSPEEHARELARVYLLHGRYAAGTGQYGLARGMLRNAVELARRAESSGELESEALRRLATVQAHVGELAEAREHLQLALELATGDAQRAVTWLQRGAIELLDDAFEEALRCSDRALALLRAERDWKLPGIGAAAHMLRGRTYRVAGRPRRALAAMHHALRLARQAGERRLEAEAAARLGGLLLDVDRVADAEARLRDALWIARDIEDRRGETLAGLWLGILLWEQDDPDARSQIELVVRQAREIGLGRVEALALAIRARMHRARGELPAAAADGQRAAELIDLRGAELADRIVIEGTRVLVFEDAGQERQARELERRMRRRVRQVNQRIKNGELRRRHAQSSERLLAAVLDREGVIYPRLRSAAP
jgi:tetratricopeptide (TPR) repeat protein